METNKPLSASAIISARKKAVFRFLLLQLFLTLFVSLGIFYIAGCLYGYSFILGASTSLIPSVYMAWRIFGYKGTRQAKEVVRSFYRGESGKLVLTAVLVSLVFLLIKPLAAEVFFAGFCFAILSHWLSPILLKH
ncbi:F0F1 ATP synthase assembly protein I [Marinomonas primoryensis]|uniref:F0F1 ATP synthase assembly protein I n=1 Tax=Marinomonas primoryensis TaxID=178399 RepID=A0A2Z4PN45_9GAMM|nr:ATP synthase subunit I [Marinomonas primoryensis]AWX99030.1 F0F1 ATP synthase assembly protein I [Marinomonas primoryensis]